jgi:hypothetical protein
MRDQDGRLAGWDLPCDHFETNISNFFEPLPEEIPGEVPTVLSSYIWRYSRDCAHEWGRSGVCLLQSWEYNL